MIHLVAAVHLVLIALWGGVVAAEAVLELHPRRHPEMHRPTAILHYWIDLLVEAPLIAGVVASGVALAVLSRPLSVLHGVKIACVAVAVLANVACVVLVLRRKRDLDAGVPDEAIRAGARRILLCAVAGLPFAFAGAGLGFLLALSRQL